MRNPKMRDRGVHERLLSKLDYNPDKGIFTWKNGKRAGSVSGNGYEYIRLDGTLYQSSRLAWLYITGEWPKDEIDHADRNPSNNRISNLREANSSQQSANSRGVRTKHFDLPRGVRPLESGRFASYCKKDGKNHYLGTFDLVEEAHSAYKRFAGKHWGEFVLADISTEKQRD